MAFAIGGRAVPGEAVLRPFLARHPELHYHYFGQVGTPEEFHTADPVEMLARPFACFSMLMVLPATGR